MRRCKRGITLVELLTVIVILAVLMAILLPAYGMVRETARRSFCQNSQKQVTLAMLAFEVDKQHLPGYANQLPAPSKTMYSWVGALMPYMDHIDVWQQITAGTVPSATVKVLYCADDSILKNSPAPSQMSYVVNDQYFFSFQPNPPKSPPFDINGNSVQKTVISKMTSTVATVMLAENVNPVNFTAPWNVHPGPWNTRVKSSDYPWLTFNAPSTNPPPAAPTPISSILTSPHGSVVILSYFDGHQQNFDMDGMFPTP